MCLPLMAEPRSWAVRTDIRNAALRLLHAADIRPESEVRAEARREERERCAAECRSVRQHAVNLSGSLTSFTEEERRALRHKSIGADACADAISALPDTEGDKA